VHIRKDIKNCVRICHHIRTSQNWTSQLKNQKPVSLNSENYREKNKNYRHGSAKGNKRMCTSADVATCKRRIKSADAKCGCVGKKRMCGNCG